MSSEYIPQIGAVRNAYGWIGKAEFDRWLEAHDREVRKEFADELTRKGIYSFNIHQIRQYASEKP